MRPNDECVESYVYLSVCFVKFMFVPGIGVPHNDLLSDLRYIAVHSETLCKGIPSEFSFELAAVLDDYLVYYPDK